MSATPAFEIGVWNAWIFTVIFLCFFVSSQFLGSIGKRIAHGEEEKQLGKFTAFSFRSSNSIGSGRWIRTSDLWVMSPTS